MTPLSKAALVALLACAAVAVVRWYARTHGILDVPNARSSHTRPVPRGGGLGLIGTFLVAVCAFGGVVAGPDTLGTALALLSCAAVATVGWLDDRRGLPVRARLLVHLLAGLAVAAYSVRAGQHWVYGAWWLFWTVSCINVVNFMDGIDGLIGSQVAIFAVTLSLLAPHGGNAQLFALMLAASCVGFLVWNWPPARIFLGDVGSGSVGFLCAFTGLLVMLESGDRLSRVYLPLVPLFLDGTLTVVRRFRNGERLTQAHRSHLYQRLANGGWTHQRVTIEYAAAALVGGAMAVLVPDANWWPAAALYFGAVFALGALRDRVNPFAWSVTRRTSSPNE